MKALAIGALLLSGCATTLPVHSVRIPPSEAMRECRKLDPPEGPDLGSIAKAAVNAALNQKDCARRHKLLIDWVNRK